MDAADGDLVVAVFGGSFDPPHIAHVLAAAYVLATEQVDRLLVVPCFRHPFAKDLAPFDDRFAMCERALGWLPRTEVSRVEADLGGDSRTLRTLEHLRSVHPGWSLRLVVGADVVREQPRWWAPDRIATIAPPIVLGRAGVVAPDLPPAVLPDVSSSRVREAIRRGRAADVRPLLSRAVLAWIEERGLYRG